MVALHVVLACERVALDFLCWASFLALESVLFHISSLSFLLLQFSHQGVLLRMTLLTVNVFTFSFLFLTFALPLSSWFFLCLFYSFSFKSDYAIALHLGSFPTVYDRICRVVGWCAVRRRVELCVVPPNYLGAVPLSGGCTCRRILVIMQFFYL